MTALAQVTDHSHVGVDRHPGPGAWLVYAAAVVVGLGVAMTLLLTVLLGLGWPGVALAASIGLVAGLAVSGWVAPALRHQLPAMLAGGFGAGLMAGAFVLGAAAVLIALS